MSSKDCRHNCSKHGWYGHVGCEAPKRPLMRFTQDCPACNPHEWALDAKFWWYEDEFVSFVQETRKVAGIVDTPASVELE